MVFGFKNCQFLNGCSVIRRECQEIELLVSAAKQSYYVNHVIAGQWEKAAQNIN